MLTRIVFIFLTCSFLYGQEKSLANMASSKEQLKIVENDTLFKPYYPEGIYISKKDFINKNVSSSKAVEMIGFDRKRADSIIHNPYFYYSENNKKVYNVFAISYRGHLYFQIRAILKNRNKNDRAQSTYFPNTFVRVIIGGENYFYTEVDLVNQWAHGAVSNLGVAGAIIANDLIKGKGVVWDFENEEFNIFKSCKDYNEFIEVILPDDVQECEKHQPNMWKVRETIEKIK